MWRSSVRPRRALELSGRQGFVFRPRATNSSRSSMTEPSTASTPPAQRRKVLPMCPVRSVTYLSGRSTRFLCKEAAPESSLLFFAFRGRKRNAPNACFRSPVPEHRQSRPHYTTDEVADGSSTCTIRCRAFSLCQHESGYWRDRWRDGKFVCHSLGMSWRIKHIARYYALNSEGTRVQSEKFHSIDRGNGRSRLGSSSATLQRRI